MNISFFDALSDPNGDEPIDLQVRKFLTAQAIMLALDGVPGIYFHSLFGSRSWPEGVEQRGNPRAINREKLDRAALTAELEDASSLRARAFSGYRALLCARSGSPSFRPGASQRMLPLDDRVFALLRDEPSPTRVLCLHNVSPETVAVSPDLGPTPFVDLLASERRIDCAPHASEVSLGPYETVWLARVPE